MTSLRSPQELMDLCLQRARNQSSQQRKTVMDKTPTQERLQTTTFSESYPTSMRDSYYDTEPAKPIVIRTKDLDPDPKGSTNLNPPTPNIKLLTALEQGWD
ncbi:uncharacterized protein LOC124289646 [Haliotis rubra]|uniref:uncharacterized protein LOC124289646 n=1 Tax=Haliotis rubra TaxID=36100 RepID=UPI001EE5C94B|nr:uncharacterized protein LOC124289646 [Haliotis rubra]